MIEILDREGNPLEFDDPSHIPVEFKAQRPVKIMDPFKIQLPWTVTIPEGFEAVVTGVGECAMNTPGWVNYISVPEWGRIIPAGEYGHDKPSGFMEITVEAKANAGAGAPINPGQVVATLKFRKVEPAIVPNKPARGRPKKAAA